MRPLIAGNWKGESKDRRNDGIELAVCGAQIANSVPDASTPSSLTIDYEPLRAAGTGSVPTDEIQAMCGPPRGCMPHRFGSSSARVRMALLDALPGHAS